MKKGKQNVFDANYWPHRFARSLTQAFEHYGIPLPRRGQWRLCDYRLGHIKGFPNTFGRVFATDGIMCFIYQGDSVFSMGHYEYFKEHKEETERGTYQKKEVVIDFLV